jgi:hypothetical protein
MLSNCSFFSSGAAGLQSKAGLQVDAGASNAQLEATLMWLYVQPGVLLAFSALLFKFSLSFQSLWTCTPHFLHQTQARGAMILDFVPSSWLFQDVGTLTLLKRCNWEVVNMFLNHAPPVTCYVPRTVRSKGEQRRRENAKTDFLRKSNLRDEFPNWSVVGKY